LECVVWLAKLSILVHEAAIWRILLNLAFRSTALAFIAVVE
jgi:hypothetical protein